MLAMYEKYFLFVWFAWLVPKYKNSLFLFLSRFALLILALSSEAATRGVPYKNCFRNIAIFTVSTLLNLLLNRWL